MKCILCILVLIFSLQGVIYADNIIEGYIPAVQITENNSDYIYENFTDGILSKQVVKVETISSEIRDYYAQAMYKAGNENFQNLDFIDSVEIQGKYYEQKYDELNNIILVERELAYKFPITEIDFSAFMNLPSKEKITISFKTDKKNYKLMTYTYFGVENNQIVKHSESSDEKNKIKGKMAENCIAVLTDISDSAYFGIIGGSISKGYNVATVYSNRQVPLSSVIEKDEKGQFNVFKKTANLKYSFAYYINPILGVIDGKENINMLRNNKKETWVNYARSLSEKPIQGYDIQISEKYSDFAEELKEGNISEDGYKIEPTLRISNGARNIKGLNISENPKSVISYNMRIAYPYIFSKDGTLYKMDSNNLLSELNYTFNVYNEKIYDKKLNKIADLSEIPNIDLDSMYLYRQKVDEGYIGCLIIGSFTEAVIDTSNKNGMIYATGRKIGLINGYSANIDLSKANKDLMYCVGDSGKENYLPKNVAFILSKDEIEIIENNDNLMGEAVSQGVAEVKYIQSMSSDSIISYLSDIEKHPQLVESPDHFKFYMVLIDLNKNSTNEDKAETIEMLDENNSNNKQFAFCIIRNNRFVNDSSLISWLKTNKAGSLSYVQAKKLLSMITGDFTEQIEKLTYPEWAKIQEIKAEVNSNKKSFLVSSINVTSMVLGIFLIIFSVLICLVYWIDVFNTFTDFSILSTISFGKLYPITDKSLDGFVGRKNENTKFVTFWGVVGRAAVMLIVGCLLLNSNYLVYLGTRIYHYWLSVFGR